MSKSNKKVVQSKTVLTAPNLKRLSAFLIDYVIVYLILATVISVSRSAMDLENASTGLQALVYLALVIISLIYFVIVPIYVFRGDRVGQTIGKKLMG